jgi:hypothetical protein
MSPWKLPFLFVIVWISGFFWREILIDEPDDFERGSNDFYYSSETLRYVSCAKGVWTWRRHDPKIIVDTTAGSKLLNMDELAQYYTWQKVKKSLREFDGGTFTWELKK